MRTGLYGATRWQVRTGPVLWDHFFHGETYDASLPLDWEGLGASSAVRAGQVWSPALVIVPPATAPTVRPDPPSLVY